MIKTTQKALKKYVATGIAHDITRYSFEEAEALRRAHRLETIAVSSGVYGLNGALIKDENGKLNAITARNQTISTIG